jgi:hypothetical protein
MSTKQHKPPRKDCQYSAEEMDQILPFKAEYKRSTQPERFILMKTKILPAMFNYWQSQGRCPTEEEGTVKTKVKENDLSRN